MPGSLPEHLGFPLEEIRSVVGSRPFLGRTRTLQALLAGVMTLITLAAHGANWSPVAVFNAAGAEEVARTDGAAPYVYSTGEIPAAEIPADSRQRRIVFGNRITLVWLGAITNTQYRLKAEFLSDSDTRVQQMAVNGTVLEQRFDLPKWKVLEREWRIPASAVVDSNLSITVGSVAGPNAVLSRLEVWSDTPHQLSAPPPIEDLLRGVEVPMPRLSPRPVAVAGIANPLLLLSGTWKFHPTPPPDFARSPAKLAKDWREIEVPGEWAMQGFVVPKDAAAGYWREFELPVDWAGGRIKLRFDAVHSDCRVFVNGREVGAHEGGFTPFEFDVTGALTPGRNTLAVSVKSESVADILASATQYAAHPLGGITRKVQLFALPPVHLAAQTVETEFDSGFVDARLELKLDVVNEGAAPFESVSARATLLDGARVVAVVGGEPAPFGPNEFQQLQLGMPVPAPRKWDPEHPNLYVVKSELLVGGVVVEEITQRVGFRQIEIRGNRLLVNGVPVKLRGACRHEVHPTRGRSLTPEVWEQDAKLFREANVNYIRTSHYPPAEEFLDLCDQYGFFVECEAALCWVEHGANAIWESWNHRDPKFFPQLMRANLENLAANRHHPSIIIWSLANESRWSPLFAEVNHRVKLADPTRPTAFHDQCWGSYNNASSRADIGVYHYPGEDAPARCDQENRPILFGEYGHVQCYNRRELVTDPGVRDDWGRGLSRMYDLMYRHDGCLGGAIWAGIDDVFCLPDGRFVGYGMWGCISDGWRRAKPETWQVKKTYSPVRVLARELPLPAPGESIRVPVENRYNVANLSEVGIAWELADRRGMLEADIPARHRAELVIEPGGPVRSGDVLRLVFTDPRGFVCDEEHVVMGAAPAAVTPPRTNAPAVLTLKQTDDQMEIRGGNVRYRLDRHTGQFISATVRGRPVLVGGPSLMILPLQSEACEPVDLGTWKPLNNVCEDWKAESVSAQPTPEGAVEITVKGFAREASGSYVIHLDSAGGISVRYNFSSALSMTPRQWGLVFYLPGEFDTLSWERNAQWSYYPADHPGRAVGTAVARVAAKDSPYPASPPPHPWGQDATPLGGNDFSGTKVSILQASLSSPEAILRLGSDGHQSVRAFVDSEQKMGLLITGFHTGGGDGFFATHFAAERRPLIVGSELSDVVTLHLSVR